ncbi:MAG: OmpA family protein [Pseudomonadota bacterium]
MRGKPAPARRQRSAVTFEPLEPRLLLSADLGFDLSNGVHDVTVRREDVAGVVMIRLIDNADMSVLAEGVAADVAAVRITGSGTADRVVVDLGDDPGAPVYFDDSFAGDGDLLQVLAPASQWTLTGQDAGDVTGAGEVHFSGIENLLGDVGNIDTFVYEAAGGTSGLVDGGAAGFDTIELAGGWFQNVAFDVTGPNAGSITRDANRVVYAGLEPIIDATAAASKTFNGSAGADRIRIADRGTPADNAFVVSIGVGEDVVFTNAGNIGELVVNGLGGDDDITIDFPDSALLKITIDAGAGDDEIEALFLSPLVDYVLKGGADTDTLRARTNGSPTLTDVALTNDVGDDLVLESIERAVLFGNKVDVTGFTGQAFVAENVPGWVEQGPTPYTEVLDDTQAPFDAAPWDPVSGAIEAIAVDPNDRHTVFLGTVNGGIWRNTGSTEVFFDLNDAALDDIADKPALLDFAEFLHAHPSLSVEIGGHTDSSGDASANLGLGTDRANAVKLFLVNTGGIDASRLRVTSFGETRPIALNNAVGQQPLNRRVELLVQNWEPLTDNFPSLSISSLAISPLSSEVVYAGIGRTSSFGGVGGFENGLLFSNDGGDTWRVLGSDRLKGLTVSKVMPTTLITAAGAQVVIVSTFDVDRDGQNGLDDAGGIFRLEVKTDGTLLSLQKLSGAGEVAGTGLAAGHYTDLAFDPGVFGDANRPVRLYAAAPGSGVFVSEDGEGLVWTLASTGLALGTDLGPVFPAGQPGAPGGPDGTDDLLQVASKIKLALHAPSGTLYAGVLGPVNGNGIFNIAGNRSGLIGVFKTTDFGSNWATIPVPTTVDNAVAFGLHPGRQGDIHFSIVTDPVNGDIVYLGGDRQAVTTNNSSGLSVFGGRVFVFNPAGPAANPWTQIVGNNAAGTVPHADSRGMVFTSDLTMLEIDDGGLVRLQNPLGLADQGTRRWDSLNADLRISQVLDVAFDALTGDIIVGTQDDGSAHQGAGDIDGIDNDGDGTIDEAGESIFWAGTGGDGNSQATIAIDTNNDNLPDRTLRYSLHNNFQFLQVYEFNSAGKLVNAAGAPSHTFHSIGLRTGPGAAAQSALTAQDAALGFDLIPMVVNANDPTRMLIAFNGIYESINTNINPAAGQTRVLPLDEVRQIDPAAALATPAGGTVSSLVYGGTTGGVANNELVIAARGNTLQIRQVANGPFIQRTIAGAGSIRDIEVDPDNWKVVYAADATDVFRTDDVTAADPVWTKITGNLKAIGQTGLRSLEYIHNDAGTGDMLLVSGIGGVSRLRNPDAAPASDQWVRLGSGLPNVVVFDVEFIDRDANGALSAPDLLLAGTLGRGVWSISGSEIIDVGQQQVLLISGADVADDLRIVRDVANPLRFNIFDETQGGSEPVFSGRGASFDQIIIETRGGDDTLTIDHSAGAIVVPRGIAFDGGEPAGNTLVLTGGAVSSHTTGTSPGGLTFHEIVDTGARKQRVLVEQVATVDTTGLSDALDPTSIQATFASMTGAIQSLVDFLTFTDGLSQDTPLFGSSLGRALNGVTMTEPAPVGSPGAGAPPQAEQVVAASSESVNLLRRFIESGTGGFQIDDIANFTTLAQLEAALEGLDEAVGDHVSITGDLTTGFEVTLSGLRKTLSGRADVELDLMDGKVHVDGLIDVSANVTLNLVFGVDIAHGFYIRSNAGTDIVIDAIKVAADDDVSAIGRFGFLGVELSKAVLAVDPLVRFDIDILKGAPVDDDFIELAELDSAAINVVLKGNATAAPDVTLTGTFEVQALLPGVAAPFSLFDARATITWDSITAVDLNGAANVRIDPAVGSTTAGALLRFLDVGTQDVVDQLTAFKGQIDGLLGTDVPFLSEKLTQIVGLATAFQQQIIDPITGGIGGVGGVPTIQSLVTQLAASLGVSPTALGLGYDAATSELTFDFDLVKAVATSPRQLGAGVDLLDGLADIKFNTTAQVGASVTLAATVGIQLSQLSNPDPLNWFFLRDTSAVLTADILATDVQASARFGFLGIGIDEGTLSAADGFTDAIDPAELSLRLDLLDLATGTAGGRVTLREIADNLDNLGDLLDITGGGSLELLLPVETSFLPGLPELNNGDTVDETKSIKVTIADLSNPSQITVELGSALGDLGNFKNIDAASLVGLLGQLTYWLDQFRQSEQFANFDIPLVGPVLDNVLGFADAFRDKLLIDDADDGTDTSKTLLFDINAALGQAGLGDALRAEFAGDKLRLIANDNNVTFSIGAVAGLGFSGAESAVNIGSSPYKSITATLAPANVRLAADAVLNVIIGSAAPVVVTVAAAVTNDNTARGNDRWKLADASNAATFSTLQEMIPKLVEILGSSNLAYHVADDTLTWSLNLSEVFGTIDLPIDFGIDNLPDFLQLETGGLVRLSADGSLNLTLGAYLGAAPPSTQLDGSELLTSLNGGVDVPTDLRVTGASDVRTVYGQLSADAKFTLLLDDGLATETSAEIVITKLATGNNTVAADLVADINAALAAKSLATQIVAVADGQRISLQKAGTGTFTTLTLSALAADPAVKEIGFAATQAAAFGPLKVVAGAALPVNGRLTADAHFTVTIPGDAGSPFAVTVDKAATNANASAAELVTDVNTALALAGLGAKLRATLEGGRLRIEATSPGGPTAFTVTAAAGDAAVTQLRLATSQSAATGPLTIGATKDLIALRGRLTGDASFNLSLSTFNGGAPTLITVSAADTASNRFAFDIVNDINARFDALGASFKFDDPDTVETDLVNRVEVSFSDGKLTFTAIDGATTFSITPVAGSTATSQLGLAASGPGTNGNSVDFIITTRDGSVHAITLEPSMTLNQALAKIGTDSGGDVVASIASNGTSLQLADNSTGPFITEFSIKLANNSPAAVGLGLLAQDVKEDEPADGVIEGSVIAGLRLFDRFFIQDVNASIGLHLSTPTVNNLGVVVDGDGDLLVGEDGLSGTAKFGFVGIDLTGGGKIDATLSMGLKDPDGNNSDGDSNRISLTELLASLDNLGSLVSSPTLTGGGSILLDVELSSPIPGLTLNGTPQIGINVVDLGDVFNGEAPTITFVYPDLDELLAIKTPEFNLQNIIAALKQLSEFLGEFEAFDFLSDPLPLIDVSVNDLIGIADKFALAVTEAEANPAGTLQFLEGKLESAFGLPQGSSAIDLVLVTDTNGTIGDTSDDFTILKVEIDIAAGFNRSLPLDFDLGLPFDLGGGADLSASGSLRLKLDFGFGFHPSNPLPDLYIFDSTGLEGALTLSADEVNLHAAYGPLGLFIAGGSADIHGTLLPGDTPGAKMFRADFTFANGRKLLSQLDLETDFEASIGGALDILLPVYFPTESILAGYVGFNANLSYLDGEFDASANPKAYRPGADPNNLLAADEIPLLDLFAFDPTQLNLLDQLLLGVDGIDLFLESLQDILDGEVAGVSLPLIGDKLAGAADVIGDFRGNFLEDFRKAVEDLANPSAVFGAGGAGLAAAAASVENADPISKILGQLLGDSGLGLLFDANGDNIKDALDISYVRTDDDASTTDVNEESFDWDFKLGDTLLDAGGGIGFDIGIPGLGLETEGAINLKIDWELALGFGLNADDGFYLDISNASELELNVDVTVPDAAITGKLGFLQIKAEDQGNTHLGATFGIDIKNENDTALIKDKRLGFSEIGKIALDVGIAADAVVDLGMRLSLNSDLLPSAPTNFPSVVADFTLVWGIGDRSNPDDVVLVPLSELDGSFLKNGLQFVGFENVGLDLGSYLSDLIGPIADTIKDITDPIKPFLDFLTEPIPVISQLAGPTSLLDIAAMSGVINPGIIKAIEVVDLVVDIANTIPDGNAATIIYFDSFLPDGGLVIYDANAVTGLAAGGGIDLTNPSFDLEALHGQLMSLGLPGWAEDGLGAALELVEDSGIGESVGKMLGNGPAAGGFSLPILNDPSQIFGMLMGQPAVLVQYEMAALELEADFSAFFSIFGPLGVSINAEFDAQFGPFTFGYDTLGITQFADSDFRNPELLFDGFFVGDLDKDGNDVPELQFDAGLWAAAELNLGIARGGVGGGLFAEIDFDLHDPNDDGRVRIREIVTNILNEFRYGEPALSPLAMFDITGKLTAELFAFLKIDFGFFEVDEKFQITDPITLLDFESDFERFPTLATELTDGVLQLNMGKFSEQRIEGDRSDLAEEFHVKQDGAGHVLVWAPSLGVDESEAQSYAVSKLILALGGEGNDTIDLHLVTDDLRFELEGNAGDDIILAGTGIGAARILGGAGNDTLTGGNGDDDIFGETGNDTIEGLGGHDWLFGDGKAKEAIQRNTFKVNGADVAGFIITVEMKANDGNDTVKGGDGDDLIFGAGGADWLEGGAHADVLIGEGGKVTVGADRRVVTARSLLLPAIADPARLDLAVDNTSKGSKGFVDTMFGDGGNDHLFGGLGDDLLHGGDDADVIFGEGGSDTADGDGGDDIVFGDFGRFVDVILGAVKSIDPEATSGGEKDTITGGLGNDKLLGGAGNDAMHGNDGNDLLWGSIGQDLMWGDDGNDKLYGQSDADKLYGGTGDDFLEGGGSNDLALGGDGVDTLVAGYGSDTLDGEQHGDTYRISVRGGSTTELTTAYDTGTLGIDSLIVVGTPGDDTLLLRAMADSYFPTLAKLEGLIDRYFGSPIADRLAGMVQAFNDAYGPWDVAPGLLQALTNEYQKNLAPQLKQAIQLTYGGTGPALETLKAFVDEVLASNADSKLDALQKKITEAYANTNADGDPEIDVPNTMFSALTAAYKRTENNALTDIRASISGYYVAESHYPAKLGLAQIVDDVFAGYPAKADLQAIVDAVYADVEVDAAERLGTIQFRIDAAYDALFDAQSADMVDALDAAWAGLPADPTETQQKDALKAAIAVTHDDAVDAADEASFAAIKDRVAAAFPTEFATQRDALLAELDLEWAENNPDLKSRIIAQYVADPIDALVDKSNPNATFYYHNTAFVAVINDGGADVERFNYRRMEGLVVNTMGGADYVVLDDLLAAASINLGDGNDRFQAGQVFRSERVKDFEGQPLITGITAEDVFTTVEITRGWLSNGVSVPTTVNGGDGDDNFTVFRNVAVLNLNGNDGDDVFTVRAFALKGSSDNERARTDMKGDGGADTILYVVNAPVGIDGGDGFDTVRIVGTEFGDDFVVTDAGIFGAGLNVSYVNIERLVADGAEGDDRFFIQSTGLEVVTEIDGGLGSDSYFVGGNPARAPVAVVSNDLRGHSGIILHSVESTDLAWSDLPVEGLSANVADDEEAMILLYESGGRSFVIEGAAIGTLGATDTYRLRLSRAPVAGRVVKIGIVPAGLSPEDEMKNYSDLLMSLDGGITWSESVEVVFETVVKPNAWRDGIEVMFKARQDVGYEGRRFTFVNHKIMDGTTDVTFLEAQVRSLKVEMHDDDRDAVIVVPSELGNTVLEGGFSDSFQVVLSQAPTAPVTVTMALADPTFGVVLSTYTLVFEADNTNGKLWSTPQTVSVSAAADTKVEGFHTDYIRFAVSSADVEVTKTLIGKTFEISGGSIAVGADGWMQVDGKVEEDGVQAIPPEGRSFVLLPHRPIAETVHVRIGGADGVLLAASRFAVSGNTITFLSATGAPELLSGKVEVQYSYKEVGYHQTDVRDQVVDIYDNDAPTVIVTPPADGMLDVVEGDASSFDTYTVQLSKAPIANVTLTIDSKDTRTTWGASAYFENQLLLSDDNETNKQQITLTFTTTNWMTPQTVTVRYAPDTDGEHIDGNDTQVFAPDLQTVNKIRGPLIIEGAAGAGSLTLPDPLMMPWELNIRPSDGEVRAFQPGAGAGAIETMVVDLADLEKVVERFREDDLTFTLARLVGRTLEMTKGAGLDVVLDPARPEDQFDRFWLIEAIDDVEGEPGQRRLTLRNPSAIDPSDLPDGSAPNPADSEYAITSLSINFFADEREQVDYLFVFDTDSVADDVGALTSSDGVVRDFQVAGGATMMEVETSALQRTAALLGLADIQALEQIEITITVGPGAGRVFKITDVPDAEGDTKWLTLVEQTAQAGADANAPTNRSEFRIAGGDRYGRITGFGMGPNILFAGRPQGGGITYGDIEVVQVELGTGKDTVRVDYATNAEDHSTERDGDFYTLTILKTGDGVDTVTVNLADGDNSGIGDGAFALDTQGGNDIVHGEASSRQLVVFGGEGNDTITTGSGDDIVFGDFGRVDYTKKIDVGGVEYDAIVTRLGSSVPQNPVNPHVTGATNGPVYSISDSEIDNQFFAFPTDDEGLLGLSLQIISPEGHVQYRTIIGNTADTITVDAAWTEFPLFDAPDDKDNYYYRVSSFPDDQTDGLFRGARVIWSVKNETGGDDTIHAGGGTDIVIGGAGDDPMLDGGGGDDYVLGDDARFDYAPVAGSEIGETRLVSITDPGTIGDDTLLGGDDVDLLIGGLGNDMISGEGDDDVLIGDDATVLFDLDGVTIISITTTNRAEGGVDTADGGADDDIVIGGTGADHLDGGSQDDLIFGDNVSLILNEGSGDAVTPRFRAAGGTSIYDGDGHVLIGARQAPPYALPVWADWTIALDPTSENFGNDTIAGGADRDTIFGQLGDDVIQGDGSRTSGATAPRDGTGLHVTASTELASDGDDYIEGNAGSDIIFGNLGQDDLIGGSSSLFSLNTPALRVDEDDLIFGGAGSALDLARNSLGDGSNGRDADMILGDNGNIYRLVGAGAYLNFNYDNNYAVQIVPRAAELLDYIPGQQNATGSADLGAGDELHGESGDDFIYGMTGNDVIFGEGQDDDLIGGWGHDWISGGTGDDGVLGDDGRILTSRNGLTEALNGVNTAVATNLLITTPGGVQSATINVAGQLKKAVDLTPFGKVLDPLFDAALADDLIYGGWGNDSLHGGWGDDGISGAEALPGFYVAPVNAGNALRYGEVRAGEFALYLEYTPMTRIDGFLLNFAAGEGPQVAGQGTPAIATDDFFSDGEDRIFGDHGNDWVVGGTGRDTLYGGWGDDLLNADDNHDTGGGLNNSPDTHTSYEDRAYGGAGRDVLIGNTGGDRLIDWVGEFNSYLVPFAPFGNATVSRTLQPQLAEFLYALSESDGADQTQGNATDPRNGEPQGELGLVRQQDSVWQDQTGAPADPQAGNVPGGPRDVLRAADFNSGQLQALAPDSGSWQVSGGALQVAATSAKADAVAVYQVGDALPSYYEVVATIKVIKPTGTWEANSFVIFDYQNQTSFKFAGLDVKTNKLVMGQRTAAGWQVLAQAVLPGSVKSDTWYGIKLHVNGLTATLAVNNATYLSYAFKPTVVDGFSYGLNWGLVGFGSNKSRGAMDNIAVQVVPPSATVTKSDTFSAATGPMFDGSSSGAWNAVAGRLNGAPSAGADAAIDLLNLGGVTRLKTASLLDISAKLQTAGRAGIVFDRYSDTDFKWAAIDTVTRQVLIGHRTSGGWFVDAAVTNSSLNPTADFTLGVVVRGASVSVTLNGQAAVGFVFNAVGVDGRFGLFSRAAGASFDSVTVKTNDPAVPATQLAAAASADLSAQTLTDTQAKTLAVETARRWALVEDSSFTNRLADIEVQVADLRGAQLAEYANGTITLDIDAAGNGWFVDLTPQDDREFGGSGRVRFAAPDSAATGRMDLLSVLAHEMGHALGLGHADDGVMEELLQPGTRAVPEYRGEAARVGAGLAFAPPATPAVIDWGLSYYGATARGGDEYLASSALPATAPVKDWRQRFVNDLARSPEAANPNAALRVLVAASGSATVAVKPRLTGL